MLALVSLLERSFRLRLHGTGRIFATLKNFPGHYVHFEKEKAFRSVHLTFGNQIDCNLCEWFFLPFLRKVLLQWLSYHASM